MQHYMPEIFWHDRAGLLSVDIHPFSRENKYRIVTASVQKEVRIWEFSFEKCSMPVDRLAVNFIANLSCHNVAVNCVRFSPIASGNLLASGDSEGRIVVWNLSDQPLTAPSASEADDLPPNRENWVRLKVFNHDSDISTLAWSPDGKSLASASRDNSILIHDAQTGKRLLSLRGFRQFPNGLCWDPRGKYIVTMSTDRKMDLIDANKGTKLRSFGMLDLPASSILGLYAEAKPYKLFHDDQLTSFHRAVAFSPCGELIVAPAGHLEIGTQNAYGTFVFKRSEIDKDKVHCFLPAHRPTFAVRMCPVLFKLTDEEENYTGLPYRVVWLTMTKMQIYFHDSQHTHPIAYVDNIHYNNLTDACWSADGKNVVVSSLEGYNSFLKLNIDDGEWGITIEKETIPEPPPSPKLIQVRKRGPRKEKKEKTESENGSPAKHDEANPAKPQKAPKTPKPSTASGKTPMREALTPKTPKSASLKKFFRPQKYEGFRDDREPKQEKEEEEESGSEIRRSEESERSADGPSTVAETEPEKEKGSIKREAEPEAKPIEVRKKKRIEFVTISTPKSESQV